MLIPATLHTPMPGDHLKTVDFDEAVMVRGHGGRLWIVLSGQRSRIKIRDCPRSQTDLNGTGLTEHPVLDGLDRASRPIAPNPSGYSALQSSHNP
jgi:hypothetical protein